MNTHVGFVIVSTIMRELFNEKKNPSICVAQKTERLKTKN
jgi:hypothetical protein